MARLKKTMTLTQFDHGYWYAEELKAFARGLGIPGAIKLRKDELEKAIKRFLASGKIEAPTKRKLTKTGVLDIELGLRADLPIVHYASNEVTKAFILAEARKRDPSFDRKPGTRYLLNRWREAQLTAGKKITYGDLVMQAMALNASKQGPLRIEHGRYMNFISDFMAANKGATHAAAVRAWGEVKMLDAPKTYASWKKHR